MTGDDGKLGHELYDRDEDPQELVNVAGNPAYQDIEQQLRTELERRIADASKTPAGMRRAKGQWNRQLRAGR